MKKKIKVYIISFTKLAEITFLTLALIVCYLLGCVLYITSPFFVIWNRVGCESLLMEAKIKQQHKKKCVQLA